MVVVIMRLTMVIVRAMMHERVEGGKWDRGESG